MKARSFRDADGDRQRGRRDFDPIDEGERYGLAAEVSREIWEQVCRDATGGWGQVDEDQAQRRFHTVAARTAMRGGRLRVEPGKLTLADTAPWGADPRGDAFADIAPGKVTRLEVESWRTRHVTSELPHVREVEALLAGMSATARGQSESWQFPPGAFGIDEPAAAVDRRTPSTAERAAIDGLVGELGLALDDADRDFLAICYGGGITLTRWSLGRDRAAAASQLAAKIEHARAHAGVTGGAAPRVEPLDDATRRDVERATGVPLGGVMVERDAILSAAGRAGEALGDLIRLAPGVAGADVAEGRRVRVHEAVHVAQSRASGASAATTSAVEAEAEHVAGAVERGERAPVSARPAPGQAHGLDLGDVAAAVGLDPMAWIRAHAPALSRLATGGLDAVLQQIGDTAGAAVRTALSEVGLDGLVGDAQAPLLDGGMSFDLGGGCCECLQHALETVMGKVRGFLDSGVASRIRTRFDQAQQSRIEATLDSAASFFDMLHRWGQPLVHLVDSVSAAIAAARTILGAAADVVWREIAVRLGLDPNLPPREAIEKKARELWAPVQAEIDAARAAVAALWAKIRANPIVAKVLKLADDCQRLWRAIQLVREANTRDPAKWLGILATETRGTVFESLIASLQGGWGSVLETRDAFVNWGLGVLQDLGILDGWNSSVPILHSIGAALRGFVASVRGAIESVRDTIQAALTEVSTQLLALWDAIRPLLSFCVGFAIAAAALNAGNPIPMIAFLAGQAFLQLDDCHKEAIGNFVLDLMLAFVEWVPARLPVVVIIKAAASGFLTTLRAAPAAQKIAAMDTVARVLSLDVEVVAGFFVGIVEGLWDSTLGLIVRIAIWPMRQLIDQMVAFGRSAATFASESFESFLTTTDDMGEWLLGQQVLPQPGTYVGGPIELPGGGGGGPVEVVPPGTPPPTTGPDAAGAASAGAESAGEGFEAPPPFPDMPDPGSLFDTIFRRGVTREDLEAIFARFNLAMDELGRRAGSEAAQSLITFLSSRASAFEIGEFVGHVVGRIAGEVILILLTVGIGAAIGAAVEGGELMVTLGRNLPRLAEAVLSLRRLITPLIELLGRFGESMAQVARSMSTWLAEVGAWAERQLVRILMFLQNHPRLARRLARWLVGRALGDDDDEEDEDEGEDDLDSIAERAAQAAWAYLAEQMPDQVRTLEQVEALLREVTNPTDVPVQYQVEGHGDSDEDGVWRVVAVVARHFFHGRSEAGAGWIAFDEHDHPRYAVRNDHPLHEQIMDEVIARLGEALSDEPEDEGAEVTARHAQAEREVEQINGSGRLLRGIVFRIVMEEISDVIDDHLIGTNLEITPNRAHRFANIATNFKKYLGARRVGRSGKFRGNFTPGPDMEEDWNWTGYPSGSVTRHPANAFLGYRNYADLGRLKPGNVDYEFLPGGETPGGESPDLWREELDSDLDYRADELQEEHRGMSDDDAEEQAKLDILAEYHHDGYTITEWDELYLVDYTGWEAHHILEHSWSGLDEPSRTDPLNFQYLNKREHRRFSNFWNTRRDLIKHALGIG